MRYRITRAVIAALTLMLACAACSPDEPSREEATTPTTSGTVASPTAGNESPRGAPSPTEAEHVLSGRETGTSDAVELRQGLYRIRFSHDSPAPLGVAIVGPEGDRRPVVEGGLRAGEAAVFVSTPGEHTFDVAAEGVWELAVDQISEQPARALPQRFQGEGMGISDPLRVDGNVTLVARLVGQGRLEVRFLSLAAPGSSEPLVVDEPGESTHGVDLEVGTYVVAVTTRGNPRWSFEVTDKSG